MDFHLKRLNVCHKFSRNPCDLLFARDDHHRIVREIVYARADLNRPSVLLHIDFCGWRVALLPLHPQLEDRQEEIQT
jgi:hypothetical protein